MIAPIVVCGARRAGTTLMMAVLCSDPRANPPLPEAQALTRMVEAYQWAALHHDDFVETLLGSPDRLRRLYSSWVTQFLEAVVRHVPNEGLLVLKHPAMMRVLGSLLELAPALRPVVMVRDPRDQVASEREVAARAGRPARPADELAANLTAWFDGLDPAGLTVVRYEDLVVDFVRVKQRLEADLNLRLSFDPSAPWPDLGRLAALRKYPSWGPKYGRPVDARGVGRYVADLDEAEIAVVEDACASYMTRFGYLRHGIA